MGQCKYESETAHTHTHTERGRNTHARVHTYAHAHAHIHTHTQTNRAMENVERSIALDASLKAFMAEGQADKKRDKKREGSREKRVMANGKHLMSIGWCHCRLSTGTSFQTISNDLRVIQQPMCTKNTHITFIGIASHAHSRHTHLTSRECLGT